MLDSGRYEVRLPEDAAVLTAAWLLRAGDRAAALDVIEQVAAVADRLRLLPRESRATVSGDLVHRRTVGEAAARLRVRPVQPQVERQREALAVWAPFGDRLVELWWAARDGHAVGDAAGGGSGEGGFRLDDAWRAAARSLLSEYSVLAATHSLCGQHRNPRSTIGKLVRATRACLVAPAPAGAVAVARSTVAQVVAKRGEPGSAQLGQVRARQKPTISAPRHAELARLVADRLQGYPSGDGLIDPAEVQLPVSADESVETGLPQGHPLPPVVARVLGPTRAAPVETLLTQGLLPSAEVLAELVPQVTSTVVSASFPDPALGRLAAATYSAFRRRRSLLLRGKARQVQVGELPWFAAAQQHAERDPADATAVFHRVAALAIDGFPHTILPNPLVEELQHLSQAADMDVALVEELAADIFEGSFSPRFAQAAHEAAELLAGTVYPRYYGFDLAALRGTSSRDTKTRPRLPVRSRRRADTDIGPLCRQLAGVDHRSGSVAANGSVIEWGQVLTTHNLAGLVLHGAVPVSPWARLADRAWAQTCRLLEQVDSSPVPLRVVKKAAYAWRQALVFACLDGPDGPADLCDRGRSGARTWAARQVLTGLQHVAAGGQFDANGQCPDGRRFLGWTTEHHWVLAKPGT